MADSLCRVRARLKGKLNYAGAGNLTWDGQFIYAYDAWNRLAVVKRGWRDDNEALQAGAVVATMTSDAAGRRTGKVVTDSGDWNHTYRYYHSGGRMIEERNGSNRTTRRFVWGTDYVDQLEAVETNDDPNDEGEQDCETQYWALRDGNFNVLGLADTGGDLLQRTELTPYGQGQTFVSAGGGDSMG